MKRLALAALLLVLVASVFGLAFAQEPAPETITLRIMFSSRYADGREPAVKAEWDKFTAYVKANDYGTSGAWRSGAEAFAKLKARDIPKIPKVGYCGDDLYATVPKDPAKLGALLVALDDAMRAAKAASGSDRSSYSIHVWLPGPK